MDIQNSIKKLNNHMISSINNQSHNNIEEELNSIKTKLDILLKDKYNKDVLILFWQYSSLFEDLCGLEKSNFLFEIRMKKKTKVIARYLECGLDKEDVDEFYKIRLLRTEYVHPFFNNMFFTNRLPDRKKIEKKMRETKNELSTIDMFLNDELCIQKKTFNKIFKAIANSLEIKFDEFLFE
jgi:hypothetical protein